MLETIYATYATCTIKAWYIYMLKVGEVSDAVWWSIIQTIIIININKDEFFSSKWVPWSPFAQQDHINIVIATVSWMLPRSTVS